MIIPAWLSRTVGDGEIGRKEERIEI